MPGRNSKGGMGRKSKFTSGMILGKSLQRDRVKRQTRNRKGRHLNTLGGMHTSELDADAGSITQTNSLADFLATAAMAERDFKAERGRIMVVGHTEAAAGYVDPQHLKLLRDIDKNEIKQLQIPKRPKYFDGQTPEEFDLAERTAFLEWRRKIAQLEKTTKDAVATPFEKNLNMWRQLWRVIERSDVLIQIVDARNPLLYRSEDLEDYIDEVGHGKKRKMLILNKADFLSFEMREQWARYFTSKGIEFVFFSAKLITEELEKEIAEQKQRELEEAEREKMDALQKEIASLSTLDTADANGAGDIPAAIATNTTQKAGNAFDVLADDVENEEESAASPSAKANDDSPAVDGASPENAEPVKESQDALPNPAVDTSVEEAEGPEPEEAAAGENSQSVTIEQQVEELSVEEQQKQELETKILEKTKILTRDQMLDLLESFEDAQREAGGASSESGDKQAQITVGMLR